MTLPSLDEVETAKDPALERRRRRAERYAEAASAGWKVWLIKIVALAVIDALAVYALLILLQQGNWLVALVIAAIAVAVNVVYLVPGLLPAKYLTPGLIFLVIFQIFVVIYTVYIAFTNYGSGHISS